MASLLDLIRKQITGEMSDAYLGNPEYLGTSRNKIDNLISPQSVRNLPAHMNVAVNQSPKSPYYIPPELANDNGILSLFGRRQGEFSPTDNYYADVIPYPISGQRPNYDGMSGDLSSYVDATRKNYENYQTDQQFMKEQMRDAKLSDEYANDYLNDRLGNGNNWGSTEGGQGQPFNPIKGYPDVVNPANDFTLYADTLGSPNVNRDTERDSMEKNIIDRSRNMEYQRDMAEIDAAADQVRMMEENNELDPAQQFLGALPTDDDLLTDEFKQGFGKVEEGEKKPKNIEEALIKEYGKEAEGILGVDSDTWLNLAAAFNTMRLDPDDSLITAIKSIRESKKNKRSRQAVIGQMEGYRDQVQNDEQKARLTALINIAKAGYGDPEQLVDKAFKVFQPYTDVFLEKNAPEIFKKSEQYREGKNAIIGSIERENEINDILSDPNTKTGFGAEFFKDLNRMFAFFGSEEARKKATTLEQLDALLGSQVFSAIKDLGIGARGLDTPAEREFLRQVMTGTINQSEETLRALSWLRKKSAIRSAKAYNDKVDSGFFKNYDRAMGTKTEKIDIESLARGFDASPNSRNPYIQGESWKGKLGGDDEDEGVKDIKDY